MNVQLPRVVNGDMLLGGIEFNGTQAGVYMTGHLSDKQYADMLVGIERKNGVFADVISNGAKLND